MLSSVTSVFLADDDEDDCLFFKEALATVARSVKLTVLNNGEQLMQLLNNEPAFLPDVLFLDLNMPRKNGFECLEEIKQNNKLNHIKVIILSTSLSRDVADRLYNGGADYYIRKPSTIQELKKVLLLAITTVQNGAKGVNIIHPMKENFVLS